MKSIGKKVVHHVNSLDGQFTGYSVDNRTVYQDKNGDYFINWTGYKRQIECIFGIYINEAKVATIKSTPISVFMQRLRESGGNVFVIGSK